MTTRPVAVRVSQATRLAGSSARQASRMASEIWSAILSGCPSVTDSEVNKRRFLDDKLCFSLWHMHALRVGHVNYEPGTTKIGAGATGIPGVASGHTATKKSCLRLSEGGGGCNGWELSGFRMS